MADTCADYHEGKGSCGVYCPCDIQAQVWHWKRHCLQAEQEANALLDEVHALEERIFELEGDLRNSRDTSAEWWEYNPPTGRRDHDR